MLLTQNFTLLYPQFLVPAALLLVDQLGLQPAALLLLLLRGSTVFAQ
ncbi:hypothetical protein IFO70_04220 [Phormidium tenue FACHB-886]|nr:hypothetical protein [Phormidium tenue FACHB-886]